MQVNLEKKSFRMPESYSAGLVSQSFWFLEFKKVAKLRREGCTYDEIKKRCVNENLFGAGKEYRALRMAGYLITRLKALDEECLELFANADLQTQKIINLIAVLKNDRLFFEFLYEVYREKIQLGADCIQDSDVKIFFTRKETQSDLVAAWSDSTKKRLGAAYLNFMSEGNLLAEAQGTKKQRKITPPIIDVTLEAYLKSTGQEAMLRALTGEN